MTGFFGPLITKYFDPIFGYSQAIVDEVTITGHVSEDINGDYNTFIIRQIPGVINVSNQQIIRRNRYITPNQSTGEWTANIPPTDYEFIFRSGQSAIREYKVVSASSDYEDLEDYSGII